MTGALLATLASPAHAGACCLGTIAPVPTRLGPCERIMVGAAVQGEAGRLRWDRRGALRSSSVTETGVQTDLAVGVGFSRRTQIGATVPLRATWRQTPDVAGAGGGMGDLRLIGRYNARVESTNPGLWLTLGARLPTGRAWTEAEDTLLADVTGLPGAAVTVGAIVERTFTQVPWLASVSTDVDRLGVAATGQAGIGRSLGRRWTVLGALGHTTTVTWGSASAWTDRTWFTGRLIVGRPVRWRGWAAVVTDLPLPWVGREQALLTRANIGFAFVR